MRCAAVRSRPWGGTPQLADACAATRLGDHFGNDAFWLSVLRWFIAHPTFDLDQVGPVVDFVRHVKFDCRWRGGFTPAPQPGLSMAGRTPDALLRRMERWHAQLHRNGADRRAPVEPWPACGIHGLRPETRSRRTTTAWTIEELLSAGALEQEGLVMGHCVGSYAGRCAAGDCSIWRVKAAIGYLEDTERWTAEVSRDRVIVQVRGKCNEPPRAEVLEVLRDWAARERLSLAAWLGR